jgi:hypothetical protein
MLEVYFRANRFHIHDSYSLLAWTLPRELTYMNCSSIISADHMLKIVVKLRGELVDHQFKAKTRNVQTRNRDYRPVDFLCDNLDYCSRSSIPMGCNSQLQSGH